MKPETKLEVGSSYWIHFMGSSGERAFAATIVEIGGELRTTDAFGNNINALPRELVKVRKMHEFQRLQWMAGAYRRVDDILKAHEFERQSYRVMPDAFYLVRIERLAYYWNFAGGTKSNRLKKEIALLRLLRPDLPVDDIPCVAADLKKERDAHIDRVLAELDADDFVGVPKPKLSLLQRIINLF